MAKKIVSLPMAQFGTHGCGKTMLHNMESGETDIVGDCPACGEVGAQWSGCASSAARQITANPDRAKDGRYWEFDIITL